MRPANPLLDPSVALSTFASMAFLAAVVSAQDNEETSATRDNRPAPTNEDSEEESSSAPVSSRTQDNEAEETSEAPASTSSEEEASETSEPPTSTESQGQTRITGGVSATEDAPTGFPSLSKFIGIPTYAAPIVPDTRDAPFMQHSTLPDGTVFIAVGAILGAFGVAILLWRFIVTCMLRRSAQRAAMAQHSANSKTSFPAPPAPFYKYTDQNSTMSLSGAAATAAAGRGVRRTTRGPIPSSNPSQSNLFFSPTAAASNTNGNRGSAFLPSGFYAAGSGSPGPNHGHSISLTNLRPDSRGHFGNASRNTLNPSPPESPQFPAARRDMSASSLNLNTPPGNQRAPSAYLEDLLADDPSSFPPPHMPAQRQSANMSPKPGSPNYRS